MEMVRMSSTFLCIIFYFCLSSRFAERDDETMRMYRLWKTFRDLSILMENNNINVDGDMLETMMMRMMISVVFAPKEEKIQTYVNTGKGETMMVVLKR